MKAIAEQSVGSGASSPSVDLGSSKVIRCVKVRRPDTHASKWCAYRLESFSARDEFDGAEPGEVIEMEYCELTEKEFDALPDFDGW